MQTLETTRIRELFSHHGIRCTRQREDIYAALHASRAHPTADELFQDARRDARTCPLLYEPAFLPRERLRAPGINAAHGWAGLIRTLEAA